MSNDYDTIRYSWSVTALATWWFETALTKDLRGILTNTLDLATKPE